MSVYLVKNIYLSLILHYEKNGLLENYGGIIYIYIFITILNIYFKLLRDFFSFFYNRPSKRTISFIENYAIWVGGWG